MKKIFLTAIAICSLTIATQAQTGTDSTVSKEDKAKMKAQREQEVNDAIKELQLTDDQAAKVKDVLSDAAKRGSELKKDETLSEADKAAKKEEINNEKNDKLQQIMGADKYKQWNAIRKRQKEQSNQTVTPAPDNSNKPQ